MTSGREGFNMEDMATIGDRLVKYPGDHPERRSAEGPCRARRRQPHFRGQSPGAGDIAVGLRRQRTALGFQGPAHVRF